nr:hypothetical protein [Tanacetum cinerariifolium]
MIHYLVVSLTTRVESSEDKESLGDQEDASKQRRMIDNIDKDVKITLVDETQGRINEEEMFRVDDLDGDEVIIDVTAGEEVEQSTKVAEKEVNTDDPITTGGEVVTTTEGVKVTITATTPQISKDELTVAQTLIKIKAAKPKARGVIVQEPSEFRTTSSLQPSQLPQAKDKEVARKLEAQMKAEMEEEKRIARVKDKANIVVITQWDEVLAKIDADMELAQKIQTEEQEQLIDVEKQGCLWNSRIREGNSFQEREKLKRGTDHPLKLNKEVLCKTQAEVTEGSSKRAGDELKQESAKRQRLEKKDDSVELKRCLEIVPKDNDDERFKKTKPVDDMDNLLFQILKTVFKHHAEDNIWRLMKDIYLNEVFGYTPLMKTKLLIKKLKDSEVNAACDQLVLLVYKVTNVFNKVNAARARVRTADRVTTAGWIKIKID